MGSVKVYHSDQAGAPVLNGVVGSLIDVFDAVLVNGYNQVDVASITRVGSIVTVQTVTPHGYDNPNVKWWNKNGVGNIATISGATQPEYNGEWAITYVNDLTFTYDIGTATPSSPATGATITTKRAPAGFSKPFSDTNRAAYRSNDPTSRRHYMAVNDIADCPNNQGAMYASVRGFEEMSGLDDWKYPFPTVVNANWGQYFCKASALNTTARSWTIISDGKLIIIYVIPTQAATSWSIDGYNRMYAFGDFLSMAPDNYATVSCFESSGSTSYSVSSNCGIFYPSQNSNGTISGSGWTCVARRISGAAQPVWAAGLVGLNLMNSSVNVFGGVQFCPFPNIVDGNMYVAPLKLTESGHIRGTLPIYESAHGITHSNREVFSNVKGYDNRTFMALRGYPSNTSYQGMLLIDITGPWS